MQMCAAYDTWMRLNHNHTKLSINVLSKYNVIRKYEVAYLDEKGISEMNARHLDIYGTGRNAKRRRAYFDL
jgi:hypothetical protein